MQPISPGGAKQTIVEEGTQFRGSLTSTCPVVVHGRIEGDVETPGLVVSPSGAVKGRVKVGEVESQGEIEGEFDAETIRLAGRVRDKTVLRAQVLEVRLSTDAGSKMQVVFGETELAVGEAPTDETEAQRRRKRTDRGAAPEVPPPEGTGAGK